MVSNAPRTLVLVPTEVERQLLARNRGFCIEAPCELCGFGPVAAAARTSSLMAQHEPERVVLVGIAGTFDPSALAVGTAAVFARVAMHGIGIGTGAAFVPAGRLGFQQWPGEGEDDAAIGDEIALAAPVPPVAGTLLSACTASATSDDARERTEQWPGAVAEDMEGFGVALACRLAGVPVAVVRGISNEVGDRRVDRWKIPTALKAAWPIVGDLVGRAAWNMTP
ncbi:MAG: futalosine hydrolase [Acidobacteria bacterium]|jgi:futalosine hydrolase|nr:futalosine hydrolase [Acidobacteriota bacterium]HJN43296.1 futalosine hydrolase [Vicinamibacterales bacterium]|tara:strand:- start:1925 stop:2596 length:672 start_codon:yes stop_codon:yes gene_type:complete